MNLTDQIIDKIIRFPVRILFFGLVFIVALGGGVKNLFMESGMDVFFSEDDPNFIAQRELRKTYGKEDNLIFVIDAGKDDIFEPGNLAVVYDITQASWQMPNARRVDSITNYLHPEVEGDDIVIAPLIEEPASLTKQQLQRIEDIALSQKALVGKAISKDGTVAAINVSLNLPADNKASAVAESVEFARQLRTEMLKRYPYVDIKLAGWAVTEQTLAEITSQDSATLMPALLLIVFLLIALILRSVWASVCTWLVIFLSILTGMGFAGWMGIGINSVNVSAPTIILTLAVADSIHLLNVFLERLNSINDKRQALAYAMKRTLYPIILTSATTALGFLTLNFSDSPPFQSLGTIAAVGVIGALWITLTILPGLILLLPFTGRHKRQPGLPLSRLADMVITHHNRIFWASLVTIAVIIGFIPRIEINDDPTTYFSDDVPLSQAMNLIEKRLSGTQTLHYSFDSGQAQGIGEPDFLQRVDRFVQWLRAQPEVVNVESFTDTLKRLNQVMHEDDPNWHRLPGNSGLTAQYILLYEISVPYGQDVTHQISADKSSLKVSATLKNQKSQGLIAFEKRSRSWMNENLEGLSARGSGQAISFARMGLQNIDSMLKGSLVAIALVSLCLIIAFRSLKFGLISFVPNLFPALVTLGLWGAIVVEVNIAVSVVFSLTLGIIVDDTTHFLVKYLEARKQKGLAVESAIRFTFDSVGSALLTTSIVLAVGFLALTVSDFRVNSTSGLLVAFTILVAIVLDLLFLPTLLMKTDKWMVLSGNRDISDKVALRSRKSE